MTTPLLSHRQGGAQFRGVNAIDISGHSEPRSNGMSLPKTSQQQSQSHSQFRLTIIGPP
jgi:hypothetical protein